MENLEFASGKYRNVKPLSQGVLESFSAEQTASGRPVYCHRIKLSSESAQPLVVLLATAMSRSEAVRQRVLDAGEEGGYWYVVTVAEERCVALREWLQFENDHGKAGFGGEAAPVAEKREPGEFTRMMMRQQLRSKMNVQRPTPNAGERSEFTRFFSTRDESTAQAQTPAQTPPATSSTEPGEFTQYFSGGLPKAKSASSPPLAPAPAPASAASSSPPDFSEFFKTSKHEDLSIRRAQAPDLSKPPDAADSMFDLKAEAPRPPASQEKGEGEYTKLFGPNAVPPPRQPSAVASAPVTSILKDPMRPAATNPPLVGQEPQSAPSMLTENSIAPGRMATGAAAAAASTTGSFRLPPQVNVSASNPLSSLQGGALPNISAPSANIGFSGASVNTPIGSASASAPTVPTSLPPMEAAPGADRITDQKKLIIFFAVLAILAVVLIAGIAITQK